MSSSVAEAPAKANAKFVKKSKSKKASSAPKKTRSYPPYSVMINEAIAALKERTGSSQIAITKFIQEKQKSSLPTNFKKLLFVQLKKLVVSGKLVKVKNSYKLPPKSTSVSDAKPQVAAAVVSKPKAKNEASAKQKVAEVKRMAVAEPKAKKAAVKPKAKKVAKTVKAAKSAVGKTPVKKAVVATVSQKTPLKGSKKPKNIKSPAKKARATSAK